MFFPCIFDDMRPIDIRNKNVLLSPLNWGMGHVSRCIGLIHQLLEQENEVIIACDANQQEVFKTYFPELVFVVHSGYPFEFSGKGNFAWDLLKKIRTLQNRLKKELIETKKMVDQYKIDLILSDHRYGFCSEKIPSIFITHQYHLPVSGLQSISDNWHKKRVARFDHVWILDYDDNRLSGKLTEGIQDDRVQFVGPFSRFGIYNEQRVQSEIVVVISGPEIYAQQFADEMVVKYPNADFICSKTIQLPKNIRRVSEGWRRQDATILKAKRLISRSGYSTIMDLEVLKIKGELYPTQGQAEQIYLHELLTDCSEYTPLALRDHSYEQKSPQPRRN